MKKILLFIICISMFCIPLSACQNGNKPEADQKQTTEPDENIYGTWLEDYFGSGYIFNSDGTGEDTFWELSFTYNASNGFLEITFDDEMWGVTTYDYSINGDTLSLTQQGSEDTFDYHKK